MSGATISGRGRCPKCGNQQFSCASEEVSPDIEITCSSCGELTTINKAWISTQCKPGVMRSGGGDYLPMTVGELRAAIADLDEDVEIGFGGSSFAWKLIFYRFKWRGDKLLFIELNDADPPSPGDRTN
jgi:hypothetical protein